MPVYEYDCPTCGVHEVHQRITEAALTACATCGEPVRRLISATAFLLKGSGWYATDYAGQKEAKVSDGGGSCGADACAGGCAGLAEA